MRLFPPPEDFFAPKQADNPRYRAAAQVLSRRTQKRLARGEANEAGNTGSGPAARRARGVSRYLLGDQSGGRADIESALQSYDPAAHRHLAYQFGQDQRVGSLALLAHIEWIEGRPDNALRVSL